MFYYRFFNEIIKFGECKDISAVYSTMESLKTLFQTDIILNETLDGIKNNYISYNNEIINNILENGYNEQITNNILKPLTNIFNNVIENKFACVYDNSISLDNKKDNTKEQTNDNKKEQAKDNKKDKINDNKDINEFDIYTFIDLLDSTNIIKNGVFVCSNYKDYSLAKIQLLNILYSSDDDVLFKDISQILNNILTNDIDLIEQTENIIYLGTEYDNDIITTLKNSVISSTDSHIFAFMDTNIIKDDNEFKKMVLNNITPNIIYKTNFNYWLFDCIPNKSKLFEPTYITLIAHDENDNKQTTNNNFMQIGSNETITEDNEKEINIIHSFGTDWTQIKRNEPKQDFDRERIELIKELKLFELESSFYNDFNTLFLTDDRDIICNSHNKFNRLHINKNILYAKPRTIKIQIKNILKQIVVRETTINKHNNGIFPLIDSVNTNHGIIARIDSYDVEASETDPIISIGFRRGGKGVVFVHSYNLSRCRNVKLFRVLKELEQKKEEKKKFEKIYDYKTLTQGKKIKTFKQIKEEKQKYNSPNEQDDNKAITENDNKNKNIKKIKINPYNVAFCLQKALKEVIKDEDPEKYLTDKSISNLTIDLIV